MVDIPLQLALEPILPRRMPERNGERQFHYGFDLRIPDGPLVAGDDPLLSAVGAEVATVHATAPYEEALQDPAADPGTVLSPRIEPPDEDGDPVVGVWDLENIRCLGLLPWKTAGRVAAAIEHRVRVEMLALSETRSAAEDRRVALEVLIAIPATLRIRRDPDVTFERPARPVRRRVVLFADDTGDVRWWDATAQNGPAEVDELPVSRELRRELKRLRKAYSKLSRERDDPTESYDPIESDWQRGVLAQEGLRLWQSARRELGREYAVGYLGPGMDSPAWSPAELSGDCDDPMPF